MIATKFSVLQHVCVVAFTRASRHRSFTVSASVLLGMSEHDLQQLAVEFGQRSYRAKQLHHLIYKRKAKEIQDFSHLPQAFRNDLIEADWKIGRSPIYHTVTAADGTVKLLIKLEDNRLIERLAFQLKIKRVQCDLLHAYHHR